MTRRAVVSWASVLLLGGAVWAGGNAAYIALKANLAQTLMARAWAASAGGTRAVKPWAWADTWPVARLVLPSGNRTLLVLGGASGRNLAFGPAHLTRTPWPGAGGNTIIAGHRDTHFRPLAAMRVGDPLALERAGRRWTYRVADIEVMHEDSAEILETRAGESLILVTCYPFAAVDPGTPWRYVVRALPAG